MDRLSIAHWLIRHSPPLPQRLVSWWLRSPWGLFQKPNADDIAWAEHKAIEMGLVKPTAPLPVPAPPEAEERAA